MKTTLPQDKKFGQKFTHNDANAVKAAITELDGNISNINSLNLWIPKDAKANKAAIVTAYPTPAKNWAAMALDDGYIYVNDGLGALAANWVNSGQKQFPQSMRVMEPHIIFNGEIAFDGNNPNEIIDTSNPPLSIGEWDWQSAYLKENGEVVYYNGEYASNFIPLKKCTRIQYDGFISGYDAICFYDAGKVFISGISAITINGGFGTVHTAIINVPSNSKFIRVTTVSTLITKLTYLDDFVSLGNDGDKAYKNLKSEDAINDESIISTALINSNINTNLIPVVPTDDGGWDWQYAYLKDNGELTYYTDEIQTRLIEVIEGATYEYVGKYSGTTGIGYYSSDKKWIITLIAGAGNTVTSKKFTIPRGVKYISFNCWVSFLPTFKVTQLEGLNSLALKNFVYNSTNEEFNGTPIECSQHLLKSGNGYFSFAPVNNHLFGITLCPTYNFNNENLNIELLKIEGDKNVVINLNCSPASNILLPQKENTKYENNIFTPDFPMAVMQTKMEIYVDNVISNTLIMDGTQHRPFVRNTPAMLIRYIKSIGEDLYSKVNLKLYITRNNNIIDKLQIKDESTLIYQYQFDVNRDITHTFNDLVSGLAGITGTYAGKFSIEYGDLDNMKVSDIIATKSSGMPFVTLFKDNYSLNGNNLYDNYPVFIEGHDSNPFDLDITVNNGRIVIFFDGVLLFDSQSINIIPTKYHFSKYYGISCKKAYCNYSTSLKSSKPVIKGLQCHDLSPEPSVIDYSEMKGTGTAIGAVTYFNREALKKGFINVSQNEVARYIMSNGTLPEKCWFLELDDLGGRVKVGNLLSDIPEYIKITNILKSQNVKLGLSLELNHDSDLYRKIYVDNNATELEKETLCTTLSNEQIIRLRGLMKSCDWTVSIHSLIDLSTDINNVIPMPLSTYDRFKSAIQNTIKWYERMFEITPICYVTHGTGNSSPYFRRLFPLHGIPITLQDSNDFYSIGKRHTFINRNELYWRQTPTDLSV